MSAFDLLIGRELAAGVGVFLTSPLASNASGRSMASRLAAHTMPPSPNASTPSACWKSRAAIGAWKQSARPLDIVFHEDDARTPKDYGPQNRKIWPS